VILAHLANFAHVPNVLALYFQEAAGPSFSFTGLLQNMGWPARIIVLILFIMSIWSLAVMIDRYLYYSAARKQSREFAPKVAGALKDGRLDEAIKVADRCKKSHLAEVVTSGLQEFRSFGSGGSITVEQIEASKRALERSEAIVSREAEAWSRRSRHHWIDRSVHRPSWNRDRYLERLPGDRDAEDLGYRRGCRRYLGSSGHDRVRSAGCDPRGYDVQLLHQQGRSLRRRDGQQLERTGGLLHQAEQPLILRMLY